MRQIRLRKLRRKLGLYEPPAAIPATSPGPRIQAHGSRQHPPASQCLRDPSGLPRLSRPDWHTGAPDFVILGAQKSGTTWWFRLIEQHPGVVQPAQQRPELHFFDRLWAEWPSGETIERYHRYFPRPAGSLVGEKTPGVPVLPVGLADDQAGGS